MKSCGVRRASLAILLAGSAVASAQTPAPHLTPRSTAERQREYEEQRRVTVAAIVTDASGEPVAGLTQADFTVTENGKPRSVVSFQEVRNPGNGQVHVVIALDAINDDTSALKRQVKEVRAFLAAQKSLAFPITLVVATEGGLLEGDASSDPAALRSDLDLRAAETLGHGCDAVAPGNDLQSRMGGGIPASAQGASGLSRADCQQQHFLQSMNALHQLFAEQQNTNGRAIIIWLGPGWPLPQSHESGLVTDSAAPSDAGDMAVTLSADMRHGQVTFDGVSWGEFERDRGLRRKDPATSIDAASRSEQEAMLTIPALAQQSGGLPLAKSKNFSAALNRCLLDAQSFYTLSFDPAAATKADEFRVLDIHVDKPGATVRALRSYFKQPE